MVTSAQTALDTFKALGFFVIWQSQKEQGENLNDLSKKYVYLRFENQKKKSYLSYDTYILPLWQDASKWQSLKANCEDLLFSAKDRVS